MLAELFKLRPKVLICLGATAAKALIDPRFRLMAERGIVPECRLAPRVIATFHPAYLLRQPDGGQRRARWEEWIRDLRAAREH